MHRGAALLIAFASLGLGCDPGAMFGGGPSSTDEAKPADEAAPATASPDPPARPAATVEQLKADPGASTIGFAVAKATGEHVAEFEDFEATVSLSAGQPDALGVVIQMASVRSDREGLTKHLKSADFFDVDRFPTSTFTATAFRPAPGAEATHEVSGKLALHGVEREVTFPAAIVIADSRVDGKAELTINPRDYGINYPGLREELVDTNVLLEIQLEFPRPPS